MKRVLILTQPLDYNYGGLLQAFALQKIVKKIGFKVVTNKIKLKAQRKLSINNIYNYCIIKAKEIANVIIGYNRMTPLKLKVISQNTKIFIDQYINTESIERLTNHIINKFDIFIVGSDQVFRKQYSPVTEYFLEALKNRNDKIKFAYAASFGTDDLSEWTQDEIKICKALAPKFKAISVREDSGIEIFKKYFDYNVTLVLDPTLLLEKEDYLETIKEEDSIIKSNILVCYILDKTTEKKLIINRLKEKTGLELFEIMPEETFNKNTKDITKCIYPSVSKWLAGFRDASFVVTDSFHGMVFSIIFNKPFICIANKERGLTRFTSLLKIFGLEDRLILLTEDFSEKLLDSFDYHKINDIKKEWQAKSIEFLKENLINNESS